MNKDLFNLYDNLSRLKGYEVAYSTSSKDRILVEIDGKKYILTLTSIDETEFNNEVINKYLT